MEKICIIIPAYNPDEKLIHLYNELKTLLPKCQVIIVNDGSKSREIFDQIPTKILTHNINLGKGEALKNGFKYIIKNIPKCQGIVTADCDMQHTPEDIATIVNKMSDNPSVLYVGSRFSTQTKVPLRSRIGNNIMSFLMKLFHGIELADTQTGLRGIPISFAKELLNIQTTDFSFETEMLIEAKKCNLQISEIPIETIYIDNNKYSHFKPLKDSYKICKTLLKK